MSSVSLGNFGWKKKAITENPDGVKKKQINVMETTFMNDTGEQLVIRQVVVLQVTSLNKEEQLILMTLKVSVT